MNSNLKWYELSWWNLFEFEKNIKNFNFCIGLYFINPFKDFNLLAFSYRKRSLLISICNFTFWIDWIFKKEDI